MWNQTLLSENSIFEFISSWQGIAHFKDANTAQYIHCNKHLLLSFGVENFTQIIGNTMKDIKHMLPYWGNNYITQISHLDYAVKNNKQTINYNEIITARAGRIRLQNLIKIPFIGNDTKKVLGVVTQVQDLTHTLTREQIYLHYKAYYSKKEAIVRFMQHFGFSHYFIEMPTDTELQVLLAKIVFENYKAIANYLNCATKTVDAHLASLRNKMVNGDISSLLTHARSGIVSCY